MNEKQSMDVGTCPVNAGHETTACVPVSISPFADPGPISIDNCGAPMVNCGGEPCCGVVNGKFEFTVAQKMKIHIPIVFGADITVGAARIRSGQTSACINGECSTCRCSEYDSDCEKDKECKKEECDDSISE